MTKLLSLMLLAQVPSPLDAMLIAHADLANIQADRRSDYLYLSMHNLTPKDVPEFIRVMNGHCNGTSTRVKIKASVNLNNLVLRVNIRDYGGDRLTGAWAKSTIKRLADPRFTQTEEVSYEPARPWEGGIWPGDGKFYQRGAFSWTPKRHNRRAGVAPWLTETPGGKAAAVDLVAWGDDFFPVVSALWFLNQTAIQEGRIVGYYDLLGVKNQKDFDEIVRFNEKLAADLEHLRAVKFTGIGLQPRRVTLTRTVLGTYYFTGDNEKAVGDRNPLRALRRHEFKFAALEGISPLPNGMPAFVLSDDKGALQSKAPDNLVGGDTTSGSNDTRLHANLSCIRCHNKIKGENFIKDVDFEKLAKIKAYDYETLEELERLYTRDIAPEIQHSRASFGKSVLEATGMQCSEYAAAYQRYFAAVEDARCDAAYCGRDMGYTADELTRRLKAYDAVADLDPVLSIVMNGGAIPQKQWEEVIHLAHAAMRATK